MIGLDAKPEKQDRIDDLSTFGERIEQLTDELTSKVGKGSGVITKEPIYVTVVRPDGPPSLSLTSQESRICVPMACRAISTR